MHTEIARAPACLKEVAQGTICFLPCAQLQPLLRHCSINYKTKKELISVNNSSANR